MAAMHASWRWSLPALSIQQMGTYECLLPSPQDREYSCIFLFMELSVLLVDHKALLFIGSCAVNLPVRAVNFDGGISSLKLLVCFSLGVVCVGMGGTWLT